MKMVNCDKCWNDEETVAATHTCKQCKLNFCANHIGIHNSSNKTKSHVGDVSELSSVPTVQNCEKCLKDEDETVPATHSCPTCNMCFCESHLNLHNSSNKTKSHADSVVPISSGGGSAGGFVKVSGNYKQINVLGENEDYNFEFAGVSAIAIDPDNNSIFVADRSNFFEFDLETKKVKNHFKEPEDRDTYHLCYDTKDKALVYVIDRCCASTIVKISRDGKMVYWENDDTGMIRSMAVDRKDGTIYLLQRDGIDFLSPTNGKIVKSLRENLQGNNIFGLSKMDCIGLNLNNDLVIINDDQILYTNKNGKILKKYDKKSTYTQYRPQFEPQTNRIFCVQYGIDCMNEDGTCLTSFLNDKTEQYKFDVYRAGEGIDMALDSVRGEIYVAVRGKNFVAVFK